MVQVKISWFSNVHVYRGRQTNKLMICKEFLSFYCLQSLFIPPGWSPNVPCRHTNRCCIWRRPFSILYIFALDCGVKVHVTATVAHWCETLHSCCSCFYFLSYQKCQTRQTKSLKSIEFTFLLLCKRLHRHSEIYFDHFSLFCLWLNQFFFLDVLNWRQAFFCFGF